MLGKEKSVPRTGRERDNAGRSISNMLINDPFERWIGGVGVLRILLSVRAPSIWMSEGMVSVAVSTISPFQLLRKITSVCVLCAEIFQWNRKYLEELRRTAGFVRVDRISNSTASPLGITSFTPQDAGVTCERLNFLASEWTWWYSWNNC